MQYALLIYGEEPSEAWARGNAFLTPGVEDVVFCYLRFASGKIAHMHLSWLDPHKMRRLTVVLGMPSRRAAAVKLPASTTRANTMISLRSSICIQNWDDVFQL